MPRCAFLSTYNLEDFFVYDDLVKPFLRRLGWAVEDVSWRNKYVDYNQYELVIVRSTWDYQDDAEGFLHCLNKIESSNAVLENPLALMQWNLSKHYLKELEQAGVSILPTLWHHSYSDDAVETAFEHFACDKLIIKPTVSANADHTYRFNLEEFRHLKAQLSQVFNTRPFMLQAFENSILVNGEYSLFYFGDKYSHAICKMPADGDFRVQEEHGGQLVSIDATDEMIALANATMAALPEPALYARVDMLPTQAGLAIIEVELIEPSLYFNMDTESASRFANVIHQKYG